MISVINQMCLHTKNYKTLYLLKILLQALHSWQDEFFLSSEARTILLQCVPFAAIFCAISLECFSHDTSTVIEID